MEQKASPKQTAGAIVSDVLFIITRNIGMAPNDVPSQTGVRSHVADKKKIPRRRPKKLRTPGNGFEQIQVLHRYSVCAEDSRIVEISPSINADKALSAGALAYRSADLADATVSAWVRDQDTRLPIKANFVAAQASQTEGTTLREPLLSGLRALPRSSHCCSVPAPGTTASLKHPPEPEETCPHLREQNASERQLSLPWDLAAKRFWPRCAPQFSARGCIPACRSLHSLRRSRGPRPTRNIFSVGRRHRDGALSTCLIIRTGWAILGRDTEIFVTAGNQLCDG